MACDLCERKPFTVQHHQDAICVIVDCATCGKVPMAILKRHAAVPSREERDNIFRVLRLVGEKRYGKDNYFLDEKMKTRTDHYHVHVRAI